MGESQKRYREIPVAPPAQGKSGPAAPSKEGKAEPAPPPARPAQKDEVGGPTGLEPTRYGDWERNGRCTDF